MPAFLTTAANSPHVSPSTPVLHLVCAPFIGTILITLVPLGWQGQDHLLKSISFNFIYKVSFAIYVHVSQAAEARICPSLKGHCFVQDCDFKQLPPKSHHGREDKDPQKLGSILTVSKSASAEEKTEFSYGGATDMKLQKASKTLMDSCLVLSSLPT